MRLDGRYRGPVVEVDATTKSDAQTVETFRPGMRLPAVLAVAIVTSIASIVTTYMLTHADRTDCASKGELHALDTKFDTLVTSVTALGPTMATNAAFAHNELVELRAKVDTNSNAATAKIDNLTTKLDLFMARH